MGCVRKLSLDQVTDSYNVNYVVMPFRLRFVTLDFFFLSQRKVGFCSFMTPYAGTPFPCKMKCKPKIQKSMVCNCKGNGGERENVYLFLIL